MPAAGPVVRCRVHRGLQWRRRPRPDGYDTIHLQRRANHGGGDVQSPPISPQQAVSLCRLRDGVLGLVVSHSVHVSLAAYLQSRIWQPMGAEADARWVMDGSGKETAFCCFNATLRRSGAVRLGAGARLRVERQADHSSPVAAGCHKRSGASVRTVRCDRVLGLWLPVMVATRSAPAVCTARRSWSGDRRRSSITLGDGPHGLRLKAAGDRALGRRRHCGWRLCHGTAGRPGPA